MEPLPETAHAINELDPFAADDDLLDQLLEHGTEVRSVVPACIGLSYAMVSQDVTFTLVATDHEVAELDDAGSSESHVDAGPPTSADAMDEEGWQQLADETAACGVASTLSLPLVVGNVVTGGFTLYGATRRCFEGHHEELAEILGAWAGGATTNADLSFHSRLTARTAPDVLRDAAGVNVAIGLLAGHLAVDIDSARERLQRAAVRAGLDPAPVARLVIDLLAWRADWSQ